MESDFSDFICAPLVQLVEQRTENPCVRSSILRGGTIFGSAGHWRAQGTVNSPSLAVMVQLHLDPPIFPFEKVYWVEDLLVGSSSATQTP